MFSRLQPATGIAAIAAALLAGCAHVPAFRETLPAAVDVDDKAIAIIGDLQQTNGFVRLVRHRENTAEEQQRLVADLSAHIDDIGALIVVGDLVYTAHSARHWAHFDSLVEPFAGRMPLLPAIGNHDYPCILVRFCRTSVIAKGMRERFPWFQPGKPYVVPSGDLLLLFLDSETALEAQGEWLGQQLAAAKGRFRAALVFYHRPAFTNSIDRGAVGNPLVQQFIVPRLVASPLPVAVFNGHIHGFEYIIREGVPYITTAGGGGPRGPLAEEQPGNHYRGPDCRRPRDGALLRPFNYLLLHETSDGLDIEVRGFCGGDAEIGDLDRIEIPL